MYLWFITCVILQFQYYGCLEAHRNGISNGELVYLLNDNNERPNTKDIEASRRSVIDKNFMRFGRAQAPLVDDGAFTEDDYASLLKRAHENFMRFGRASAGGSTNFMRFGRGDDDVKLARPSRYGNKDENFIRFGKRPASPATSDDDEDAVEDESKVRFKRNANEYMEKKRNNNFMRFGRTPINLKAIQCSLLRLPSTCYQTPKY